MSDPTFRDREIAFVELPMTFDADRLQQEAASIVPRKWKTHCQKQMGKIHDKLRNEENRYHTGGWLLMTLMAGGRDRRLKHRCRTYCHEILDEIAEHSRVLRARILALEPGHKILPHVGNLSEAEKFRIHIPMQTNDGVFLMSGGAEVHMPVGTMWYMNQKLTHGVRNDGDQLRCHLTVDVKPNAWTEDLVEKGIITAPCDLQPT